MGTFETLSFDQGVLRFHTGTNELGVSAGLFWDKGDGEFKVMDANLSTVNYLAPDGTSWMLTKASFHFSDDFYLGPNLDKVILEGVNALSVSSDGNVTLAKSLSGSLSPSSPHLPNGSLLDGYDAYYGDDPNKGHRIGRGVLGGFGGTQGPGKGQSLGSNSAGGLSGGGGSYGVGRSGGFRSCRHCLRFGRPFVPHGGSGGGVGNLGKAAGGGALEIISAGKLIIESGVNVSMDGGSVLVNPNQGAYFSGGAGAGGSIRLVARSIVNKGNLSAKGGHASGIDPREPGSVSFPIPEEPVAVAELHFFMTTLWSKVR